MMTERQLGQGSESQGKITVNQDLASALLDSPAQGKDGMSAAPPDQEQGEKVYVDWPEIDDDEEYRFVSSRVDDYDTRREAKPTQPERTYVIKDNPTQSVAPPAVVDPKNSPLHVRILSGNTYQDETTLQDEDDYQRQLQQRIEQNSLKDAQLEIPRLDLEALRESAQDFVGDSLDVISVRSPNPPTNNPPVNSQNFERDSLDVDDGKLVDSLDFHPKLNSTFNPETNGDYTGIDSSKDPPPRETIVRPPPYGKEETQRNISEMDKYNRGKFNAQHYNYDVRDDNHPPVPVGRGHYDPVPVGQGHYDPVPVGQGHYDPVPVGQGHYDQGHDRWEDVNQPKEVSWAEEQRRVSPAPYARRIEYETRQPVDNDYNEGYRQHPPPNPNFGYENFERQRPYQEPLRHPEPQYLEDPREYPQGPPRLYQDPPPQREPQYDPRGGPPRQLPPQRHYEYVDRHEPPPQEQYRGGPPPQQYRQESRPLPEKRAHFHNDIYSQQVVYEQEQRQGLSSQRPPTPYQEEVPPHVNEQYKGSSPPPNNRGYPQGSAQDDLGIYNDESESEPSAVTLPMQNELERDLEEIYQNRKGKPRRQLQNDEQYSQMLQEKTGANTDRSGAVEEPVKKSPARSPSKPAPDFVETNKVTYGKGSKRTYGKMLEKRKDEKTVRRGPKNVSNSAGALSDPEERIEVEKPVKPSSAEEVWTQRAKRLQEKTSGKGKKNSSKQNGALRKFASESSVPSSAAKQLIPHLQPLENEPHVMAPYHAGTAVEAHPVQAVWSDDGQRVSLDINLKLVSPAPSKPPLPPVGQQQTNDSASNIGSAIHVERLYNYPYADPYSLDQLTPRDHVDQYLNTSGHNAHVNPYKALPPIPQDQNEDSYVAQYRHAKQAAHVGVQYKPYSLNDYKKMQKEVKLGGLGPDLDNETRKEKQEKKMRQQEYARQIHMKNVHEYQMAKKRVPPPPKPEDPNPFTPNLSKRTLALEYSRQIQRGVKPTVSPQQLKETTPKHKTKKDLPPKPPTRFAPSQGNLSQNSNLYSPQPTMRPFTQTPSLTGTTPAANRRNAGNIKANQPELIDLSKLLQQHQRDKENVTAIRQNIGGGPGLESKV